MPRLRIMLPFIGEELGGSHISAFTLAQSLQADSEARCTVICRAGSAIAREAAGRGLEVLDSGERAAARNSPLYDLARTPARRRLLAGVRAGGDVLHCNDIGALQAWAPAARLAGLPVVYHHRALNRPVWQNRLVLALASRVVSISDACTANLAHLPPGRTVQVRNPFQVVAVDRSAARAALLAEMGGPHDALAFGFVGNFWARKRPYFFLETCRLLAEAEPCARFVVFGRDGEITRRALEAEAARLGLGTRIAFAGFRSPAEANIAALNVLLAPAQKEPFGRTLVEALLLGVPYVATAEAGHVEIHRAFGGGALQPPDASPAEFAAAALAAAHKPEALTLDAAQRAEAAVDLSPRAHAAHMLAVYRALLKA